MNMIKYLFSIIIAAATTAMFTGCSNDDIKMDNIACLDFGSTKLDYDDTTNAWSDVFDSSHNNDLKFGSFQFSHEGYGSAEFNYFYGFCPSKSQDTQDHSGQWTPDYQFSAITGRSVLENEMYRNQPYMVAYWNEYGDTESGDVIPEHPSCAITSDQPFTPYGIYVTNSTYTYYAIKNGTNFNDPFDQSDYLVLNINGVRNGKIVGTEQVDLARNGQILTTWKGVSLEKLGEVDMIFFTMSSSSKNEYGTCIPTYFCIDGFMVKID